MPNFNYHGLFRELAYIAASIILSAIGVGSIIFVYNHTGVYGAVFFSIIVFLAIRLLLVGAVEGGRGGKNNFPHQREEFRGNQGRGGDCCNCVKDSNERRNNEQRNEKKNNHEDRVSNNSHNKNQTQNFNKPFNNQGNNDNRSNSNPSNQ